MPKQLIPSGWIEKPCRFFSPTSAADVCTLCDGHFSFWNASRYCYFCGNVFHRKLCTNKCNVEGFFFRKRICGNCEYYKGCVDQLKEGEEFTCYKNGSGESDTVSISLCEDTAEILLHWKKQNITEAVDLLGVNAKKGYSLRARLQGAGSYDPLKSITLILTDALGEQRALYINSSSSWMCQMWVEGIKCARYVYQAMVQQDNALEIFTANGVDLNKPFKTYYLPKLSTLHAQGSPNLRSSHQVVSFRSRETSLSSNTISSYSTDCGDSPHHSQLSFKSGYLSDRADTPSPTRNYYSHSHNHGSSRSGYVSDTGEAYSRYGMRYKRSSSSFRMSRPHPVQETRVTKSAPIYEKTTPGLPYIRSTLSSICPCHSYEIPVRGKKNSTGSKCCFRCRQVCPIAQDLDNL